MIFDSALSSLSEGALHDMLDRHLGPALSNLARGNENLGTGHAAVAYSVLAELTRRGI